MLGLYPKIGWRWDGEGEGLGGHISFDTSNMLFLKASLMLTALFSMFSLRDWSNVSEKERLNNWGSFNQDSLFLSPNIWTESLLLHYCGKSFCIRV